jgi:putative chitinase
MSFEPIVIDTLRKRGVNDPVAIGNVLGQIKAEGGKLTAVESLRYRPERAVEVFGPKYFPGGVEEARVILAQGEEAFGNRVYGGRMGNAPDEGYKYRGRGPIQLTGKDNYAAASKALGVDFVSNPDLAASPEYGPAIVAWYLLENRGLKEADLKDLDKLGRAIGYRQSTQSGPKRARYAADYAAKVAQGAWGEAALVTTPAKMEVADGTGPFSVILRLLEALAKLFSRK